MNTTMAMKPHFVALNPFSMLSRPRLGPMVRSSMISIGAASAPARMSSARLFVSEGGGAAQDLLGARDVLHAGELHHDAVGALLLDHRLGHAELVHALVQRADVLLHRRLLHALLHFGLERADEDEVLAVVALGER